MPLKLNGKTVDTSKPTPLDYSDHFGADQNTLKPIHASTTVEKNEPPAGWELVTAKDEVVHTGVMMPLFPYMCGVEGSRTIQPAPFCSLRIGVSVMIPCATRGDMQEAYDWGSQFVSDKITEAMADADGSK